MKIRVRHNSELDNPSRWDKRLKPYFDVAGYQHRIDQIVGLNKDAKSIIRLTWGQDAEQFAFDERTPRYWTRRRKDGEGYRYWTVPRWMLERRIEPEQYAPSWEATRWALTDADGKPVDKGPPPSEYYIFAYLCAEHEAVDPSNGWAHCCTRAYYTDRSRCWGKYRPPSEDDLQLVARAVREMDAAPYRDPYRPLTKEELQEIEVAANMQAERAAMEMAEYEQAMMREAIRLHGHRIFEGPNSFHDMGQSFQRTKQSGLYIPE